jgi:hypothetical protein
MKTINPKSTKGGIRTGLTARMPKRVSAPATITAIGSATANPPVTFRPPRRAALPLLVTMKLNGGSKLLRVSRTQ